MASLEDAIEAAEARKKAVFGERAAQLEAPSHEQMRAVFSGLLLDPAELQRCSDQAAWFFVHMAAEVPLAPLIRSAWIDGILIGHVLTVLSE